MNRSPANYWPALLLLATGHPFLSAHSAAAESDPRKLVAAANEAFARGDYQQALDGYNEAEVTLPESPRIAYNQGLAHYKLGDLVAARNHFNRALLTRDINIEASAKYNLGNVDYAEALQKQSAPTEAIDLLKSAIGHYRDALALRPDDADAKANIQSAQLLIKKLLDDLKKQQEQNKKNQNQQQNKNDNQKNQDQQQNQDQQKQQDQNDQSGQKPESDQKQRDKDASDKKNQKPDQQPSDAQQNQNQQDQQSPDNKASTSDRKPEPLKMSKQEAERLLQAIRDKERKRNREKAKRLRLRRAPVLKDW